MVVGGSTKYNPYLRFLSEFSKVDKRNWERTLSLTIIIYIFTFWIWMNCAILIKNFWRKIIYSYRNKSVRGSCVLNKWPNWETLLNLDFQTIALINICSKTTFLNLRLYLQKEVLDGVKTIGELVGTMGIFCWIKKLRYFILLHWSNCNWWIR